MRKIAKWLIVLPLVLIMSVSFIACKSTYAPTTAEGFAEFFEDFLSENNPKTNWTMESVYTVQYGNITTQKSNKTMREKNKLHYVYNDGEKESIEFSFFKSNVLYTEILIGDVLVESASAISESAWHAQANKSLWDTVKVFAADLDFHYYNGEWKLTEGETAQIGDLFSFGTTDATLTFGKKGSFEFNAYASFTAEQLADAVKARYIADTAKEWESIATQQGLTLEEYIDLIGTTLEEAYEASIFGQMEFEPYTETLFFSVKDIGTTRVPR
ncbi:MAG: hypothetical protein FWH03_04465 [Firmicutes bacterium]|nr:hypothetical protein [Bacillota bacterium]